MNNLANQKPIRVSGCVYPKPVGKRLERAPDGSIVKTTLLDERANAAETINEEFATATELFDHITNADAHTMFFSGTYAPGVEGARLLPRKAGPAARAYYGPETPVVAATTDYLAFREGPGVLRIDVDHKSQAELAAVYPDAEPFRLETHDEVSAAIAKILPEANECPVLVRASASSMIVDESGELVKGPGGWRVYIPVDDAREIPHLFDVLHLRCWAQGIFRFAFLSAGGSMLFRSIADQAMARPTQPDYPCADLGPGLKRAGDADVVYAYDDGDGPLLVAASVVNSDEDRVLARANMDKARQALAPQKEKLIAGRIREHTGVLMAKGVSMDAAERAAVKRFEAGVLIGSDDVVLDDGTVVSVETLLSDEGGDYDGRICFDPVEPDYDGERPVGKIFLNDGLKPVIHSFAHGSKVYQLKHDNETATRAISAAGDRSDAITRILALSDVGPVEFAQREKQAARALGLGNERKALRDGVALCLSRMKAHAGEQDDGELRSELCSPAEPLKVAQQYVAAHCTYQGDAAQLTLRRWRGSWWGWLGSHWAEVSEETLDKRLYTFTTDAAYETSKGPALWMPDRHKIASLKHALQAVLLIEDEVETPSWADGRTTGTLVACANGLLDIRTRELMPHSPLYFNVVYTPIVYDPSVSCPVFANFERSLWPTDDGTSRTVRQMLGYLVSGRTDLQCVFGLIGAKRGGKGTISWLAAQLLGASATPISQADLGETFGMEHLIGKSLAIIADTRTAGKNTQTVVERLLSISGEDGVAVARKRKKAWTGRLSTRIMWLSNETPYLGDASTAVASRFILMMFNVSFQGREDRELKNKLSLELPGILNAALDGLADLEREGRFTQAASALEGIKNIAALSSVEDAFVSEMCEMGAGFRVGKTTLYRLYEHWRQDRGYKSVDIAVFSRNLYAIRPGEISTLRTREDGAREYCFKGIKMRDSAYSSEADRAWARGLEAVPQTSDPGQTQTRSGVESANVTPVSFGGRSRLAKGA